MIINTIYYGMWYTIYILFKREGLNMDFLFSNNGIKSRIILISTVILVMISATFLIKALIIFLPIGIIGWYLHRVIKVLKAYFFRWKRNHTSDRYDAEIVKVKADFEELSSAKNIVDVEYTEV